MPSRVDGWMPGCGTFAVALLPEALSRSMKSSTNPDFWTTYRALPPKIKVTKLMIPANDPQTGPGLHKNS